MTLKPSLVVNAHFECIVTETSGDTVYCDAHLLTRGEKGAREFWEIDIPGNKFDEGDVFYLVLPKGLKD